VKGENVKTIVQLVIMAALSTAPAMTAGGGTSAFDDISGHYEAIRQALMNDSTEDVATHARAIRDVAAALQSEFSAADAGVSADASQKARDLLPEVEQRAGDLATANGLSDVRTAFAELTKPLVQWHGMVEGQRPVVAYCPMVKRPWLQPDEAIGNPYAPSMLRCGEVVAR